MRKEKNQREKIKTTTIRLDFRDQERAQAITIFLLSECRGGGKLAERQWELMLSDDWLGCWFSTSLNSFRFFSAGRTTWSTWSHLRAGVACTSPRHRRLVHSWKASVRALTTSGSEFLEYTRMRRCCTHPPSKPVSARWCPPLTALRAGACVHPSSILSQMCNLLFSFLNLFNFFFAFSLKKSFPCTV